MLFDCRKDDCQPIYSLIAEDFKMRMSSRRSLWDSQFKCGSQQSMMITRWFAQKKTFVRIEFYQSMNVTKDQQCITPKQKCTNQNLGNTNNVYGEWSVHVIGIRRKFKFEVIIAVLKIWMKWVYKSHTLPPHDRSVIFFFNPIWNYLVFSLRVGSTNSRHWRAM